MKFIHKKINSIKIIMVFLLLIPFIISLTQYIELYDYRNDLEIEGDSNKKQFSSEPESMSFKNELKRKNFESDIHMQKSMDTYYNNNDSQIDNNEKIYGAPVEKKLSYEKILNTNLSQTEGDIVSYDMVLKKEQVIENEKFFSDKSDKPPFLSMNGFQKESMDSYDKERVIDSDGRSQVSPTDVFPWSSIVKLQMSWGSNNYIGSGAIIDSFHVLTAGHCIYDSAQGGWADEITVIPARDGYTYPFGSAEATNLRSVTGWTNGESYQHDIGLITLDESIGYDTGWMAMRTEDKSSSLYTGTLTTAGYPGDLDSGINMYYDSDSGDSADDYNHFYWMDTYGGQSGSAVWCETSGTKYILSVHAYGQESGPNFGTRLNQNKFDTINGWLSDDASPDLRNRGSSYSSCNSTTITPENPGLQIDCDILNSGTLDVGSFDVTFYVSTDTNIDTSDYLLGTNTISSLSELSYTDISWAGLFPEALSVGDYYIGWIIDQPNSIGEIDETNNIGFHSEIISKVNQPPNTPNNPSPLDGQLNIDLETYPSLEAYVSDPNGNPLDVYFYDASDDSLIGSQTSVSSGSTTATTWTGLTYGNSYDWYVIIDDGWQTAQSPIWTFSTNYYPDSPVNLNPNNNSNGVNLNPLLNVDVFDYNGGTLDVYFYNGSDNSLIGSYMGATSGSNASIIWNGLSPGTIYSWYAEADDGTLTSQSPIWTFSTNYYPDSPVNLNPNNNSNGVNLNPLLNVDVFDYNGGTLDVYFYNGSDNSLIGSYMGATSGSNASIIWNGLSPGTIYSWYAEADDGYLHSVSDIWHFTTNDYPDDPTNPHPFNNTDSISLNPNLKVNVTDVDNDLLTVSFYNASDNSLIGSDIGVASGGTAFYTWNNLQTNTSYEWYVVVSDGELSKTSLSWTFKTNIPPESPTNISPANQTTRITNLSPTLAIDVFDNDGNDLAVSFFDASNDYLIGSLNEIPSGTTASTIWSDLSYGTIYQWYVLIDDGINSFQSNNYTFTTNYVPNLPSNPSPSNSAIGLNFNPILSVEVADNDGDVLQVSFYNGETDELLGIDYDVPSESTASFQLTNLQDSTTYSWYAVANDGIQTVQSPNWIFSTNYPPNLPTSVNPNNESTGIIYYPQLSIYPEDNEDGNLNITYVNASDNSIIGVDNNVLSGEISSLTWENLPVGTFHEWYVIIDDGLSTTKSKTYCFTTNHKPEVPTNPTPGHDSVHISVDPTLIVEVLDQEGGLLDIDFYNATDNSKLGSDLGVVSGNNSTITLSNLADGETISWYIIIDDGIITTRSPTWEFSTNNLPFLLGNPFPINGQNETSYHPNLTIEPSDIDNDQMKIEFFDGTNDELIGIIENVESNNRAGIEWSGLSHSTFYSWYVRISDGIDTMIGPIWNFTTNIPPDAASLIGPLNESTGIHLDPNLIIKTSDSDSDQLNVSFYDASDDSLIGQKININSGDQTSIIWGDISLSTAYNWFVILDDGFSEIRSENWTFTTNYPPDEASDPSPSDGLTELGNFNPTLSVFISDHEGENMDVYFYNGTDDSLIGTQSNVANGSYAHYSLVDLAHSTLYKWYVILSDGTQATQSPIWNFTMIDNKGPLITPISPRPNQYTDKKEEIELTFKLDEEVDLIVYKVDDQGNITINSNTTFNVGYGYDGEHNITIWARNIYGFYANINYSFKVDSQPPILSDKRINYLENGTIFVNLTISDVSNFSIENLALYYIDYSDSVNSSEFWGADPTWQTAQIDKSYLVSQNLVYDETLDSKIFWGEIDKQYFTIDHNYSLFLNITDDLGNRVPLDKASLNWTFKPPVPKLLNYSIDNHFKKNGEMFLNITLATANATSYEIYHEWYSLENNRVKITVNILGESQEVIILKLKNNFIESENIVLDIPKFQDEAQNTNDQEDVQNDEEQKPESNTNYYLYGSIIAISILGGGYLYRKRIKNNDGEFGTGSDFSDVSEKFDKWE